MRAHKANIQHAATKITNMPYWGQWLRLLVLNELNSNKQALLKVMGRQFATDKNGIFQTGISKKYNIVSARSNNVIIELFLVQDNDFWNSKAFRLSGEIASNANVYVTFLYFE